MPGLRPLSPIVSHVVAVFSQRRVQRQTQSYTITPLESFSWDDSWPTSSVHQMCHMLVSHQFWPWLRCSPLASRMTTQLILSLSLSLSLSLKNAILYGLLRVVHSRVNCSDLGFERIHWEWRGYSGMCLWDEKRRYGGIGGGQRVNRSLHVASRFKAAVWVSLIFKQLLKRTLSQLVIVGHCQALHSYSLLNRTELVGPNVKTKSFYFRYQNSGIYFQ